VTSLEWKPQAAQVTATLRHLLGEAVSGVYVHGSAALGGWTPTSDLDMLITSAADDRDWPTIGHQLLSHLTPATAVELSIVSAAAAASPEPPWPFSLHVNQHEDRVVTDGGHGDPDLLMHYLVARTAELLSPGPQQVSRSARCPARLCHYIFEMSWFGPSRRRTSAMPC
jgi:predicted nucleotidyltransferase